MAGSFVHGEQELSIKATGFILDMDKEYYYLGNTPHEINKCIRRDRVVYIEILDPDNEFMEILDQMEVPKDDSAKN